MFYGSILPGFLMAQLHGFFWPHTWVGPLLIRWLFQETFLLPDGSPVARAEGGV